MDTPASDRFVVQSHTGPYEVEFARGAISRIAGTVPAKSHFFVDANVARLYAKDLHHVVESSSVMVIEATEANKSLERFPEYVEHLVSQGVRRGQVLIAIGGGITQDIVCFLAATVLRGIPWWFYPTTLLAQADSCIGSKSSINVGRAKNIVGTFTPPRRVIIDPAMRETLNEVDVRSGYGEMLKVHAIDGPDAFDRIAADYPRLGEPTVLTHYIRRSLEIKRNLIEQDEFDQGPRNVMNYGHTFGHALESATDFRIPHGIAISIGADMANHVAVTIGRMDIAHYRRMHPVLRANFSGFEREPVGLDAFMQAIAKDKKNSNDTLTLILPDDHARIGLVRYPNDARFREICRQYLEDRRSWL
ncbi:MAG: 3-dehydroquinate synthase [Gemmatimonadaceae bacterium]|nr:3-dehydroquinate synthase [Gemmatimonadaceae bacterium]